MGSMTKHSTSGGEPLRVLQCVNVMDRAGLETMLMNYYRHIDRTVVQFDFLVHRSRAGSYDEEIMDLGGKIYHAPRLFPQNYLTYNTQISKLLRGVSYKIIHSHIDSMSVFPLRAAKKLGIPVRIAHSHSCSLDVDYRYPIKVVAKRLMPQYATDYWACSEKAGEFLFRTIDAAELHVVKNAIDLRRFTHDEEGRRRTRETMGIDESQIAICQIGRFAKVKNQSFSIRILQKLLEYNQNIRLFLIGDGPLRSEISDEATRRGLGSKVAFLGERTDIPELMNAMDAMLMPSLYEGVPVSLIEAQSAGLWSIASTAVSEDAILTPCAVRLPLHAGEEAWASAVLELATQPRFGDAGSMLRAEGYDILTSSQQLQAKYLAMANRGTR